MHRCSSQNSRVGRGPFLAPCSPVLLTPPEPSSPHTELPKGRSLVLTGKPPLTQSGSQEEMVGHSHRSIEKFAEVCVALGGPTRHGKGSPYLG